MAEQNDRANKNHLEATFVLHRIQNQRSTMTQAELTEQTGDGLEYINAALKVSPDNPTFLNTKALLIALGLGQVSEGIRFLRKAQEKAPDDITVKQNIRKLQKLLAEKNIAERKSNFKRNIKLAAILVGAGIILLVCIIGALRPNG